jgi:signal transduction histidine kinase
MSSLGQLVAGIAHEINNPVNFIYGNLNHANEYIADLLHLVELYQQHHPSPAAAIQTEIAAIDLEFLMNDLPKLLNSMKVGADRIQQIVLSLRNFSRMDEAEVKAVNLHDGIESTLLILQSRLKAKQDFAAVEVVKEYAALPLVGCFAGQLNQVFMNILANAIDALEEKQGQTTDGRQQEGEGHLSGGIGHAFAPTIWISTALISPDRVAIRIRDNGTGMTERVCKHLFDPFFTTKPVGRGTGLGLSISYQIVTERHRGTLTCHSTLGGGSEFVIEIPTHQPESDK